MTDSRLKNICVFCGSSPGRGEAYQLAARALADALVARGQGLVYGGASIGLMGRLADAVLEQGGKVSGVIPESLMRREVVHQNLSELHVTRSMHERKTKMFELSDAFIALPGGMGTLEELFEVCTWAQLGHHAKPCGMLNIEGYFDRLIGFLNHAAGEGFIKEAHRSLLLVADEADELLERFAERLSNR